MDTGLSTALEDVLARHGGHVQIAQDPDTLAWVGVERPTPSCQKVWVGPSLAGLAAKLDEDFPGE